MSDETGTANTQRAGLTDAAPRGDERTTLLGFLARQRDLVAWKMLGASDEVLRSVSTSSGLTLHGVVRHLENVERWWFRDVFAGIEGLEYAWTDADPDGEWHVPVELSMEFLLANYAAESQKCDEFINAAASLDAISAQRDVSLRWILVHLIEETARHLGHIDILRELADATVGEEPEID